MIAERGDPMRHQYALQQPDFTVTNIDIINSFRDNNYRHSYRNGRLKHGFIYIVKGTMQDIFFDEDISEFHLKAGDFCFIPKGCKYIGVYTEDNTEIKIVQFDLATGALPPYLTKPTKINFPSAKESINAFFSVHQNTAKWHPFYFLSCLYEMLWQIDGLYTNIPPKYDRLQNALQEMSQRYFEDRTVADYARLCNMSEVNFRRLFKEYTGLSPIDYRNDLRLSNARARLQSGEYNVSEAAEACGFTNLSFFIRLYKKKFGYTPKKE